MIVQTDIYTHPDYELPGLIIRRDGAVDRAAMLALHVTNSQRQASCVLGALQAALRAYVIHLRNTWEAIKQEQRQYRASYDV